MRSLILLLIVSLAYCNEPIIPIPQKVNYNKNRAKLGMTLFSDPNLSSDGTVACVSCHSFEYGGADPRPVSIGVRGLKGNANAPTVYNSYFNFRQFWNGRAKNLYEQADGPIHNPVEMGMDKTQVEKYLNSNSYYIEKFKEIYKSKPTYENMIDAIVEFEKALYTPNSKFDKFLRKEIKLSKNELEGYKIFKMAGCITCHNGINVGGNSFQKLDLIIPYKWENYYPDRYQITKDNRDKNIYKVPTLRNIALTAPYFHDGSIKSLKESIRKMVYHNLGYELENDEVNKIEIFLKTLTGEKPKILNMDEK